MPLSPLRLRICSNVTMTGHTSNENVDRTPEHDPQAEPVGNGQQIRGGVVQDSPGNLSVGFENDVGGDGNLSRAEMPQGWQPPADPELPRD